MRSPPRLGAVPPARACDDVVVADNIEIARQATAVVGSPAWLATLWSPMQPPSGNRRLGRSDRQLQRLLAPQCSHAHPRLRVGESRLHRSRRPRACFARRPVARLGSRSVGRPRPTAVLSPCEDSTAAAGAAPGHTERARARRRGLLAHGKQAACFTSGAGAGAAVVATAPRGLAGSGTTQVVGRASARARAGSHAPVGVGAEVDGVEAPVD